MKRILCLYLLFLCGCTKYEIQHDYKLEKYNDAEMPVCVDYAYQVEVTTAKDSKIDEHGNVWTHLEYTPVKAFEPIPVSYNYCLATSDKPVHLVEKQDGNVKICYDQNNKIKLPILYCQKDMINIQTVDVNTNVNVKQSMYQKFIFE